MEFSTTDVGGLFSDQALQISSILPFCDVNLYLRQVSNCTILPILVCYYPTILRFFLESAKFYTCHKLVSPRAIKKEKYYMWSALVSLYGLKQEEYS